MGSDSSAVVERCSVTLDNIKCDCGKVELFSIFPGSDATQHSLIGLLERNERVVAWCADCWLQRFGSGGEGERVV